MPVLVLVDHKTREKGLIRMIGDCETIAVICKGRIIKIKMSHTLLLNVEIAPRLLFLFTRVGDGHVVLKRILQDCEEADGGKEKWLPILNKMKNLLNKWLDEYLYLNTSQNAASQGPFYKLVETRINAKSTLKRAHYTLVSIPEFGVVLPKPPAPVVCEAKKIVSAKRGDYGEYRTKLLKTPHINLPTSTLSVAYTEKDLENMRNRNPLDD